MHRSNNIRFFLFFILLFQGLVAQPPKRFYTKFGGDGDDVAYSGKPTLDGQYIIAGSSTSYGTHGVTDVYLLKVDSMGKALWAKFIGGTGNDVAKSVVQLPDSGFVLAGYTNSYGAGGYDAYLLRTDKNGNVLWERTFGGVDWDFGADLVVTPNNFIFMVGNTTSFGAGKKDGFVVKYDLNGNFITQKFFGGMENEELRSIINTDDGSLATVGFTESRGNGGSDCYFLKLNYVGDTLFTKVFGGPDKDFANDVVQKDNGEYYLCGAKTRSLNPHTYSYMRRLDSMGEFLSEDNYYQKPLNVDLDEEFSSVSNSFLPYLTAFTRSVLYPNVNTQAEILLVYPSGYYYQQNDVGLFGREYSNSIEIVKNGRHILVGNTDGYESFGSDVFLMVHDTVWSGVVIFENMVGITDLGKQSEFKCYYDGHSTIKFDFNGITPQKAYLYDLSGKMLLSDNSVFMSQELKINSLSQGIYLLEILFNNSPPVRKKIIIF